MIADLSADLERLAARLRSSTVAVRAGDRGYGSGVVWDATTVVTNAHVALAPDLEIDDAAGRRRHGRVVRRDVKADLAAVTVAEGGLTPGDFRDPDDMRAGEVLVAFGHPLGVANVLTSGIAFAAYRRATDTFVRADLRLAPGNSGGPVADAAGRIVGIASMIAGGLALAVPTGEVRRFMSRAARRRLGVALAPVRLGRRRPGFAVLAVERGSRAERAGLLPGDVLLMRRPDGLADAAGIDVLRGGVRRRIDLGGEPAGISAAA